MAKDNKSNKAAKKLEIRSTLKPMEVPKNVYEAKGKLAQTGMLAARDMILGGYIGGKIGSGLGRFSLIGGLAATGLAYYFGYPGMAGFGIGMTAAGMMAPSPAKQVNPQSVDGFDFKSRWEDAKERMKIFDQGFKKKLFLDKVGNKGRKEENKQNTVEDTQTGPVESLGNAGDPIDEIMQQLVSDAINFQRENGVQSADAAQFSGLNQIGVEDEFGSEFEEEMEAPLPLAQPTNSMVFDPDTEEEEGFIFSDADEIPDLDMALI